jgi:uncharacterized membrane protein YccC
MSDVDVELPLIAPKEDPRASAGIARAKSLGGLAGFALAAFASYSHEPAFTIAERALIGGIAGYLVAWAVALAVWRRIMKAETRHAIDVLREQNDERERIAAEARAAAAAAANAETIIL